ncbi:MAG: invasion associated locus B family protein [Alphaproteobacteria bacterium]
MIRKIYVSLCVFCTFFGFFVSSSYAAEPRKIGKFGDWTSYVLKESGGEVCYMVSKPVKAEGQYTNRGEIFALITHRPAENTKDVFSYITGYTYKQGSDATVTIDGKSYMLFTQDDTAWAPDAEADARLAEAIQKGSEMVVRGTSRFGTLTTDTYSLKGSSGAYRSISKECGVR